MKSGVRPGDTVALLCDNEPAFIFAAMAAWYAGAVLQPVNTRLHDREMITLLNHSEAAAILAGENHAGRGRLLAGALEKPATVIPASAADEAGGSADTDFPGLFADPHAVSTLMYTSGTTGSPKGAMITPWMQLVNARAMGERKQVSDQDRFLCTLPLFHANALVASFIQILYAGGSLALLPGFSVKTFLDDVRRFDVTAFSGVPTIFAILNEIRSRSGGSFPRLRFCACGGAPMPADVLARFEESYGARILEGYGMTETTCAVTGNPWEGPRRTGSIGSPLADFQLRIVDDAGQELPDGEVGEILVRGDSNTLGYRNDPERTAELLHGGWLHTGDLGRRASDGFFYIAGRKKDLIIRGGVNIHPIEIEGVLYRMPGVAQAAVIGDPDAIWGQTVHACIQPADGVALNADQVRQFVADHLAAYKVPERVTFFGALPVNASGKILKQELMRLVAAKP
ncbi:MAG: Long-chain-fatty-acid--CoA ligase [Myxococcota bacterium]|nr:Long-chain-fatty-acid--CoA ligase [Myxococcota bacterium]